jgi:hypothetical protein
MSHCYLLLLLVAVLVQAVLIAEKVTAFGVARTMPRTTIITNRYVVGCAFIGRTPSMSSSQSQSQSRRYATRKSMMRSLQLPNINVRSSVENQNNGRHPQQKLFCCNNLRQRAFSTSLSSSSFLKAASTSTDPITVPSTDKRLISSSSTSSSSSCNDDDDEVVPLVFLHGMKGSHLAFHHQTTTNNNNENENENENIRGNAENKKKKIRSWLTLGGLFNFPRKVDYHPDRDISLPLSYSSFDSDDKDNDKNNREVSSSFPIQDRGEHFVDGTVDHIVELSTMIDINTGNNKNNFDFFPFYGHVTKFLEEINDAHNNNNNNSTATATATAAGSNSEINDIDDDITKIKEIVLCNPRPTRSFVYDWRRNLFELTEEFYQYCEKEFPDPDTKIQIVAHSLGGLIAYGAMKLYPNKFTVGAVLVGVPFGTGMQYIQDLHKGYFTELGRCRQFLPPTQFTFSSHWSFFPTSTNEIGDLFVDVTEEDQDIIEFEADLSTIGKKTNRTESSIRRPATPGKRISIDFYNPDEWEKHEIGIFDPYYRNNQIIDNNTISEYKQHMKIQMDNAKRWRNTILAPLDVVTEEIPPIIVCSTNTVPTVNQILRRRRQTTTTSTGSGKNKVYDYFPRSLLSLLEKKEQIKEKEKKMNDDNDGGTLDNVASQEDDQDQQKDCRWEYDYGSGQSVPGDGRIDYDKSFPPNGVEYKTVDITSLHAKQFCWENNGDGNLGTIMKQVNDQLMVYQHHNKNTKKNKNVNKNENENENTSSSK